jgi:hypothetical protein
MTTQLLEYDCCFDAAEPRPPTFHRSQKPKDPEISESMPRRPVAEFSHALGEASDRQSVDAEFPNGVLQLELIIREAKFHLRSRWLRRRKYLDVRA